MRYLLSIYGDETGWNDATPEQVGAIMAAYDEFGRKVKDAGVMLGGEGLQTTNTATTVRVRNGETLTTDGPFAETREQLGGYYLLECKDLDEAIRWAAQIPGAQEGSVEVRPVMDYEAMGLDRHEQAAESRQG
ncbi:MAG TPA: YciI family protein [Solirubrobacteraceae bacterium]|nr:YciI family protein [Solirubrobacteraceae bacterium]